MAALFGAFVMYTKELQVHPMKIIMFLAFAESIFQYLLLEVNYICKFKQNQLLSWTVYFGVSDYDLARATTMLATSSDFFALSCVSIAISLNTFLCLDLILMVRFPFTKKEGRTAYYLAYSVLVSVAITTLTVFYSTNITLIRIGAYI